MPDNNMSIEELNKMFDNIDKDNSGVIDYSEFISASINRKQLFEKKNLEKMFNMFDKDGNGSLSVDEFKAYLSMGDASNAEWDEIIKEVDEN